RIEQRKFCRRYPLVEINAGVDEGNTKRATFFTQAPAQGSTDLKIAAHVVRACSMKPVIRQGSILRHLRRFGLDVCVGITEKAGSHGSFRVLDKLEDCLRAQVNALDQVVAPIKDKVFEGAFDKGPHAVSRLQIIVIRVDAERRCSQVKAHLQSVECEPRYAVTGAHSFSQRGFTAAATATDNIEHAGRLR